MFALDLIHPALRGMAWVFILGLFACLGAGAVLGWLNRAAVGKALRADWPFILTATILFALFLSAFYPGLLISDAMTAYSGAVRGSVDDGYGFFWTAALIGLAAVFGSPLLASLVQAGAYVLAGVILLWRLRPGPSWLFWGTGLVLLAPPLVLSAFYQHRDSAFGLAFIGLILTMARPDARLRVLFVILATLCCLLRPDFAAAYLGGMAVLVWSIRRKTRRLPVLAIPLWLLPVVLAALFRAVLPEAVPIGARGGVQAASYLIQPLCAATAEERSFSTLPDETRAAIFAAYPEEGLRRRCAIGNIWIQWSEDNHFQELDDTGRKAFFKAAARAVLADPVAVLARGIQIHLSGNGLGPELEGFMDILADPASLTPQFDTSLIDTAPRLSALRDTILPYVQSVSRIGMVPWRAILFNSLLPLALLLLLHRWGRSPSMDAAVAMIVLRSGSLLAAPSAQYAYHFPVHLAALAVLALTLHERFMRPEAGSTSGRSQEPGRDNEEAIPPLPAGGRHGMDA